MTTIILILALTLICGALILLAGRMPASARVPVAVAMMTGVTGYLLVGRPGVAGAPVPAREPATLGDRLEDPRRGMAERFGPAAQWLGLSDGLIRTGRTEAAARALEQGLRRYPRNIDLWVGYGNALTAHAGGVMTPAAAMAFDEAADIDPTHPAPPFFAGLALAQGGDFAGARQVWQALLDRSPADASYRADLMDRLAQLPPEVAPAAGPPGGGPIAPTPPATAPGTAD